MTGVPIAPANGIDIAYETFGDPSHPTVLLIMGLGAQRIMWDDGICALLVARGHHVVRFDNRDIGESTWIDTPGLDVGTAVLSVLGGDTSQVPYLLSDMAADAVGLLDHLGIDSAHIVGASMGGMIAQTIAIEHPTRVRTLTSIMSTTGEAGVGEPSPELAATLLAPPAADRDGAIEAGVATMRAIGCQEHFDEARARSLTEQAYDRGYNPAGTGRQLIAILASGSRAEGLARLDLPALVIHGRQDQLVNFTGGQRTAELIAGADFLAIDDMAHDLPQVHWTRVADTLTALTHREN
ncbi:alpha/beta fold hydrolase [Aquihabitans sp. McL0605]|uniref:alpha/beta fold hydrolase n=1 Tax=Aquihabitans sp. McL0605 TaxID=3415671 RepID=UPI003CE782F4